MGPALSDKIICSVNNWYVDNKLLSMVLLSHVSCLDSIQFHHLKIVNGFNIYIQNLINNVFAKTFTSIEIYEIRLLYYIMYHI